MVALLVHGCNRQREVTGFKPEILPLPAQLSTGLAVVF
jgi:hypothetical protein